MIELGLVCRCGTVRGRLREISPETGIRIVCYCDDCQAYAHWLGHAAGTLDAHGGTEVFQVTPMQLAIDQGADQIRCMRLSNKGMLRWHTGCCKTAIGNTMTSARVPFVGVPVSFLETASDRRALDASLGPIRARVQGRFARGGKAPGAHARAPLGIIARWLRQLLGGLVRGAHVPTPLFRAGRPIVEPIVLSPAERERLRSL